MSDSLKFSGTITAIMDEVQVTDKFRKREIVINDNSQYPQEVPFQFTQDKCDLLDKFEAGQDVEVSFNLRGREWTDKKTGEIKYFGNVEGWRIEKVSNDADKMSNTPTPETAAPTEEDEDLPF